MPRSALKAEEQPVPKRFKHYAALMKWREGARDPKERQRRILAWKQRATIYNRLQAPCDAPESRSLAWLIGWNRLTFPGFGRALEQVFSEKASKAAAESWWRKGRAPAWALRRLLELMVERVSEGQAIVERLRVAIGEAETRQQDRGRHLKEWRATRHAITSNESAPPDNLASLDADDERIVADKSEASGVGMAREL